MKHTPTPWQVCDSCYIESELGLDIAETLIIDKEGEGEANAEHIVHCVNLHDELVAILKDFRLIKLQVHKEDWGIFNTAEQAIAKAEEKDNE